MAKKAKPVLLTTDNGDLGIVPASKAKQEAKAAAKQEGTAVTLRDPTTDKVLGTEHPPTNVSGGNDDPLFPSFLDLKKTLTPEKYADRIKQADQMTARANKPKSAPRKALEKAVTDAIANGAPVVVEKKAQTGKTATHTGPAMAVNKSAAEESENTMATTQNAKKIAKLPVPPPSKGHIARKALGPSEQVAAGRSNVARKPKVSKFQKQLDKAGVKVGKAELRELAKVAAEEAPVTRVPAGTRSKKAGTAARTAIKATTKARKPVAQRSTREGPTGITADILKLASRTNGASAEELNALTAEKSSTGHAWKGTPWKWSFENPKGNGWCQRWGYSLALLDDKKTGVRRYKVTKTK